MATTTEQTGDVEQRLRSQPRTSRFHAELARRILHLVREADRPAGWQLKEQWLAEQLNVSRSPVRAALRLLAELGIVTAVPNQGCFLATSSGDLKNTLYKIPPTEEERLYHTITRDRFADRIGISINVTELGRKYGVSRSMIGRVLTRLADEGLLERDAGRGWNFLPSLNNPAVYEESYRFRMQIEPAAILDPGFRPDPLRFAEIRRAHEILLEGTVHTDPFRRLVEIDVEFHETIGGCSQNRFILQAIQQQSRLRRMTEFQFRADRGRMAQSCREHLSILDALEAGDRERAAELMRMHIRVSRDLVPSFAERE
ncbi:MAG: GntR family transcriptional regulator [Alphaproteobacteria bacterium]|nr:GntR family transcriptional regulator [Alphaproteobacteria bacterium]